MAEITVEWDKKLPQTVYVTFCEHWGWQQIDTLQQKLGTILQDAYPKAVQIIIDAREPIVIPHNILSQVRARLTEDMPENRGHVVFISESPLIPQFINLIERVTKTELDYVDVVLTPGEARHNIRQNASWETGV